NQMDNIGKEMHHERSPSLLSHALPRVLLTCLDKTPAYRFHWLVDGGVGVERVDIVFRCGGL
ncbi:Hypothetical predicted protein, partial [Pelobates cultripes]